MYNHDDLHHHTYQNIAYQREMDEERAGAPLFPCSLKPKPDPLKEEIYLIKDLLREPKTSPYDRISREERASLSARLHQLEEELEVRNHEV